MRPCIPMHPCTRRRHTGLALGTLWRYVLEEVLSCCTQTDVSTRQASTESRLPYDCLSVCLQVPAGSLC